MKDRKGDDPPGVAANANCHACGELAHGGLCWRCYPAADRLTQARADRAMMGYVAGYKESPPPAAMDPGRPGRLAQLAERARARLPLFSP